MTDQIDTSTVAVAAMVKPTSNGKGRIVWPGGPAKKQRFSLPDNIIYYMIQNPSSPKLYLMLASSCKYFFEKKPLLIVRRIIGDKLCSSKNEYECGMKTMRRCCINVDLAKLSSKIWLLKSYHFRDIPSFDALLPQKLYKYENTLFEAWSDDIVFENFKSAASLFESFHLIAVTMTDKDGNEVLLEEIVGSLPNAKEFRYQFSTETLPAITALTVKEICNLDKLCDLQIFCLGYIPEGCDVEDFEEFIMRYKDTKILLNFHYVLSAAYRAELAILCDTVIAAEGCKCIIEYCGQDLKKFSIMCKRYYK